MRSDISRTPGHKHMVGHAHRLSLDQACNPLGVASFQPQAPVHAPRRTFWGPRNQVLSLPADTGGDQPPHRTRSDMDLIRHPIVFLHLPRTGGGAVHAALARVVGAPRVSPVRSADQAGPGASQFPPGHALYSGPLDWDGIDCLPRGRFTFTVLRDPQERIASLYFHFRARAEAMLDDELALPENLHLARARNWTADDCFFGGDAEWQARIRDVCDNVYSSYFGARRIGGTATFRALPRAEALATARRGLAELDGVIHCSDLRPLEAALHDRYGLTLRLAAPSDTTSEHRRWPRLLEAFGSDAARRRIEGFAERDEDLLARRAAHHAS